MCKVLITILKGINYYPVDATHNLWGIIDPADMYLAIQNASFAVPTRRLLFNTTLPKDSPNIVLQKPEVEHTARHNYCSLYDASKNGVIDLSCTTINKTWYQDLKDTNKYYLDVTATNMLGHF